MKIAAILISSVLMAASLSGCESREEAQMKQAAKDQEKVREWLLKSDNKPLPRISDIEKDRAKLDKEYRAKFDEALKTPHSSSAEKNQ